MIVLEKKHIVLGILFCLSVLTGFSQTYVIPDPNFKQCIINHDPNLLDVNGDLIIANAANVTGRFYCAGEQLRNVDGIQFFTSISELELRQNLLTDVSPIASLTQLAFLRMNDNELVSIPSLAAFSDLIVLDISNNALQRIPELPVNSNLIELNASENFITEYPDLSNQNKMEFFSISRNNDLKTTVSYANLTSIKSYSAYLCGLSSFPDVSMMTELTELNVGYNNLTTIPDLSANQKLVSLYANNNALTSFADLSSITTLDKVRLYNNFLSYEDFTKLLAIPNYSAIYKIINQYTFPNPLQENYTESDSVSFITGLAKNTPNVTYRWFYNNNLLWESDLDTLNLPFIEVENSGSYYFEISSSDFPDLTLQSHVSNIQVEQCVNEGGFRVNVTGANCKEAGSVEVVAENQPQKGITYLLESTTSGTVLYSENGKFNQLNMPEYILYAKADRCKKEIETIQLPIEECEEAYFTPNGDGMDDTFYFQQEGTAKIYNKWGQKIQELKIPQEWNGSISSGIIAPGYYTVEINNGEKVFHLSVVY